MHLEKSFQLLGIVFLLILSSGCASTTQRAFIPINQAVQDNIQSTNAFICFRQQNFCLPEKKSKLTTYTGGGLIPALIDVAIDNSRAKENDLNVQPINDALVNNDFDTYFYNRISQDLKGIDWLRIDDTEQNCIQTKDELIANTNELNISNVLVMNTLHQFSPDAKLIVIKTYVAMYPKGKNSPEDLMYKNSFIVKISLKENVSGPEESIPLWLANDGSFIKSKMKEGLDQLANMIIDSLAKPNEKSKTSVSILTSPNA